MSNLPQKLNNQVEKALGLESTDKIIKFLESGAQKLTQREHEMLDRFDVIDNMLREGKSTAYISRVMKMKYGISERQTSRDINDTRHIYGSVRNVNKSYYQTFLLEQMIKSIMIAKDEHKIKEKVQAEKNLLALLDSMEDQDDGVKMTNLIINIISDPASVGGEDLSEEEILKRAKKYMRQAPKDVEEAQIVEDDES